MKHALIVFAKKPEAGKVKTRLVPPFTFEEAKELYTCFLKDSLIQYTQICPEKDLRIFLAVAPSQASDDFGEFLKSIPEINQRRSKITIMAQAGSDLGEKIFNAFKYVFSCGYLQAVVIGTDHPTLPEEHIIRAFTELDHSKIDCVIGPAEDGGYYLLGLKEVKKEYFKHVLWSTGKVFDKTVKNLKNAKKTVYVLPEWYDVDDKNSLFKILNEMTRKDGGNVPFYSKRFLSQMKTIEV